MQACVSATEWLGVWGPVLRSKGTDQTVSAAAPAPPAAERRRQQLSRLLHCAVLTWGQEAFEQEDACICIQHLQSHTTQVRVSEEADQGLCSCCCWLVRLLKGVLTADRRQSGTQCRVCACLPSCAACGAPAALAVAADSHCPTSLQRHVHTPAAANRRRFAVSTRMLRCRPWLQEHSAAMIHASLTRNQVFIIVTVSRCVCLLCRRDAGSQQEGEQQQTHGCVCPGTI
jgi:hypothetical protein